jgi:DNA-binding MarR family transcriptional regulator
MQLSDRWASVSVPHLVTAVKSRLRQVAFRRLGPHRISPQQYQLLMAIAEQDGRCQGDLARCTWMDKPTASRILRTLQDRGLIRAAADPAHGRRVLFHLQPAAEPLVRELQDYRRYIREGIERGFTPEERVQIRALLGAVMANLDRMEAELGGPADGTEE